MPASEFESWRAFHQLYPIDDLHRIHRPAALIASAMSGRVDERLKWLQPDHTYEGLGDADARTLAAFGLKPPTRH